MAAAAASNDAEVERIYTLAERLSSKNMPKDVADYNAIITAAKGKSVKAKLLVAKFIPNFFTSFPELAQDAMSAMLYLVETGDVSIRKQAIVGCQSIQRLCHSSSECSAVLPEFMSKLLYVLGKLLASVKNGDCGDVHNALMSVIQQDVKSSLKTLFNLMEDGHEHCEKIIYFLKDEVFPRKAELLQSEDMEKFVTDLIKKSVQYVTVAGFEIFMVFLRSLTIFGDSAPRESLQELVIIIEAWAPLNSVFNVSNTDHVERWISCMCMALPLFMGGASSSKLLCCVEKIVPAFDKIPEEKQLGLLKSIAASSPHAAEEDSPQLLRSVVELLKIYMPSNKVEDLNYTYVECLLYTFHHLANKTPNATSSLCGYKIGTGQSSGELGGNFSECYKDFTERLTVTEETVRAASGRLTQKGDLQTSKQIKHSYGNILTMTKPLRSRCPSFFHCDKIILSWMEQPKKPAATLAGRKDNDPASKKRGEGMQVEALSRTLVAVGRGQGRGRGHGQGSGRGRGPWDQYR